MNEFSNAIAQMGVNAELVGQALKEMCERLQQLETPPAVDKQEDRQPDSKDDLEIFDQIEEKEETPIIRFENDEKNDEDFLLELANNSFDSNNYFYRIEW